MWVDRSKPAKWIANLVNSSSSSLAVDFTLGQDVRDLSVLTCLEPTRHL